MSVSCVYCSPVFIKDTISNLTFVVPSLGRDSPGTASNKDSRIPFCSLVAVQLLVSSSDGNDIGLGLTYVVYLRSFLFVTNFFTFTCLHHILCV